MIQTCIQRDRISVEEMADILSDISESLKDITIVGYNIPNRIVLTSFLARFNIGTVNTFPFFPIFKVVIIFTLQK